MLYLIFRRNLGRNFKSLTYVASVSAKDSVCAMQQFCGNTYHPDFVAVSRNWAGLSSYQIYGLNLNYA